MSPGISFLGLVLGSHDMVSSHGLESKLSTRQDSEGG